MEKMVLEGQKQLIWGMCVFMYPQGDWRKPRRKSGSERTSGPSEGHPVALLPPPNPDSQDMTGEDGLSPPQPLVTKTLF